MAVSPARKAAFQILLTVERGRAHSDELLRGKAVAELSALDRHLATALVLGVLCWQVRLDQQILQHLNRPGARLDSEIQIALRLGAFQLRHMERVPAHAAINESVELAKEAGHRFASRMVNAVLRKLAGAPRETAADPMHAYPEWMVERWSRLYGSDAEQAICAYGQREPSHTIRLTDPGAEEELQQAGVVLEPGSLLVASRGVAAGDVRATAAFRAERVRFQDEGSQVVAEIAGSAPDRDAKSILDACAAPGGKTLILAECNPAARVAAYEASPQRLAALRERLAPLGERVECRPGDAAEIGDVDEYDLVLADVPCSGTGTLGRNPEIRHRLKPEDLSRQAERQVAILCAAIRAVRPSGRVVYSTCSLEPEENEEVIAKVLRDEQAAYVVPMQDRIAEMTNRGILVVDGATRLASCVTQRGYLQLLPGMFGTDGFFVALLEKV
jgi:16S rRNA (cytosine967-C5)-methyltransferase